MTDQAPAPDGVRNRRSADITGIALVAVTAVVLVAVLVRLLSLYGEPVGGSAAAEAVLLIVFAIGTVTVSAGLGAAIQRKLASRQRDAELERLVSALVEPAAVTSLDGVIARSNQAMAARGGTAGRSIETLLAPSLSDPRRQLFRLTRAAMLDGFGIEPLSLGEGGQARYLVTQVIGSDTMLWRLGSRLEGFGRSGVQGTRFAGASFAHLLIAADGSVTANQMFEHLFGAEPEAAERVAELDLPREGGRVVIPGTGGRNVALRSFVIERQVGKGMLRELILFPIEGDGGSRSGLAGILDVLPVALMQVDTQGRILWANNLARAQLGPDVRLGMTAGALLEGLGRTIEARIAETAAGRGSGRPEMAVTRRTARKSPMQLVFSRMEIEGIPSIVVVMLDATELEATKAQLIQSHKMEAVGKLAGGVAHDFNNVLTAIIGNTDLMLLRNEEGSPDHAELVQVKMNANRAAVLVRQLLAFSRRQTLQPRLIAVREVISDQAYMLQRLIGERVKLRIEHSADTGHIRADPQQVEQAMMNLVVNARDAMMPEGGAVRVATRNVRIETETERDEVMIGPGEYVEITVTDTGPGIPDDVLASIFEPFFTTKAVGEGTGLGLSTVYGIVKQSGGYVFADNLAGAEETFGLPQIEAKPQGAKFTVLLPRVEPSPEVLAPPESVEHAADATGRGSILLVEDEAPVRSVATKALKLRGYEVTDSDNAEAALDMLANPAFRVDVLVSDVVMPGLDGPSFVREARRLRPGLRVVFISGYAAEGLRRELDEEDYLFLAKPFTLNELSLKVKEALGR